MNLRLAPILEKVVETTVGPSPTFSKLHVYKAITLLGNKTLGRNALAKELGIGSGAKEPWLQADKKGSDRKGKNDQTDCCFTNNACGKNVVRQI